MRHNASSTSGDIYIFIRINSSFKDKKLKKNKEKSFLFIYYILNYATLLVNNK